MNYELLYIVSNQYTEEELAKIKENVNALIKKYEGTIGEQNYLGKKKLAYPIQKVLHGYYVVTEFELEKTENIANINKELKLDKEILRAQIVSKPKKDKKTTQEAKKIPSEAEKKIQADTIKAPQKPTLETKQEKAKIKGLDEKLEEILQEDII